MKTRILQNPFIFSSLLEVLLRRIKISFMFAKFKSGYYSSDQQFLPRDQEHMAAQVTMLGCALHANQVDSDWAYHLQAKQLLFFPQGQITPAGKASAKVLCNATFWRDKFTSKSSNQIIYLQRTHTEFSPGLNHSTTSMLSLSMTCIIQIGFTSEIFLQKNCPNQPGGRRQHPIF